MLQQLINERAVRAAIAAGHEAADRCLDKASRFGDMNVAAAERVILAYLAEHGDATGEDLTDACKEAGHVPHNDKCFGSVVRGLADRDLVETIPETFRRRRKGHGAPCPVWRLVDTAGAAA